MIALVGYTGFVGSNIYEKAGKEIEAVYNSKNIKDAYGTCPELLIYAGLRAEKYLANSEPEEDMALIFQAEENIKKINPEKLILISTIDVFQDPQNVDENSEIITDNLHAYGYNRYQLELWARENYPDALIIRLPGLFGNNIKKNFIYDFINVIPFMLPRHLMEELSKKDIELKKYYQDLNNEFYRVKTLSYEEKYVLKDKFRKLGFSALNFTDSRSKYQFYNLSRLWNDIQIAIKHNLQVWHPANEPVLAKELYEFLTGEQFINELNGIPADYNYKTVYDYVFNGSSGYICSKQEILYEIKNFIEKENV